MLRDDYKYSAASVTDLTLKRKPQSIRVQLDYDRGRCPSSTPVTCHPFTLLATHSERECSHSFLPVTATMAITLQSCRSAHLK
uniref:Uncharacterized protein n=1 Tax=Anguilla anguilla TaxID=7936 RepID=A0A0E9WIQ9_ANGAN